LQARCLRSQVNRKDFLKAAIKGDGYEKTGFGLTFFDK
jgi:hypothetical protein